MDTGLTVGSIQTLSLLKQSTNLCTNRVRGPNTDQAQQRVSIQIIIPQLLFEKLKPTFLRGQFIFHFWRQEKRGRLQTGMNNGGDVKSPDSITVSRDSENTQQEI